MRRTLLFLLAIVSLAAKPALSNAEEICNEEFTIDASQGTTTGDIAINATNFPDANFRNWLLQQSYGSDGILTQSEINGITSIDIRSKQIKNLKGIEYFTALTTLKCGYNQLTSLDVSNCTSLTILECYYNQLTSLDVSNCTALQIIACCDNKIRGTNMDNLIASLPPKNSGDNRFYVISNEDGDDGNVCTKTQVAGGCRQCKRVDTSQSIFGWW